jgi:DNA-binding NarL/FixJ family response regulator
MIRLLLVDDQPEVRRGLGILLHLEPDIQIVGEASTGTDALSLAQQHIPDVVLMDIEMPVMDGIQATAVLRRLLPQCAVIILSIYGDAHTRARAQAAGAVEWVEKQGDTKKLLSAIRKAAEQAGKCSDEIS